MIRWLNMSGKENIDITPNEFFDENLKEENPSSFYVKADSLKDLPDSRKVLDTAYTPVSGLNKKKTPLALTDLIIPSHETPNTMRCNEIIEDIKEYLTNDYGISFDKLSKKDLERRLKFIEIPVQPELLDRFRDLNLSERDLIMEKISKLLHPAITVYMENPAAYKKNRQIDIAYNLRRREIGT